MDAEGGFGGHGLRLPRLCAGRTHAVASAGRALASLRRRLRAQHRRPRGLLGRGCARHRLARAAGAGARPRRASARPLVPGRRAQHLPQRARPPRRRRPRRPAGADLRQPGHRDASARTPTRELRDEVARAGRRAARARRRARRPRRALPADGARGGHRHARLRAARARSTRSCSAASRRTSSRCASTTPGRVSCSRPRAASRARAWSPTSRCSTRRSPRPTHAPEHCVILQRPQLAAAHDRRPRPRLGASSSPPPSPRRACRCSRPTRSTSSTRRARPAGPRASCATTAGTPSRSRGACRTSTTCSPGEVFWAASDVGWVVGHSYIVYAPLLAGATTVLYEGKPVGTPDAGAFWRVIEEHGVTALFTAPTAIRAIRKEDPEAALLGGRDAAVAAHALPGRRAHRPRHLRLGRVACSAAP